MVEKQKELYGMAKQLVHGMAQIHEGKGMAIAGIKNQRKSYYMKSTNNNIMAEARKKAGMTQEQLAKAIGVNNRQVSVWECGRYPMRVIMAKRIADVLNIDWVQLVDVQSNAFSSPIALARRKKGLTQTQLAKAACISQSQISNYEHGVSHPPKEVLQRIALVLETDCHSLMTQSDSQNDLK